MTKKRPALRQLSPHRREEVHMDLQNLVLTLTRSVYSHPREELVLLLVILPKVIRLVQQHREDLDSLQKHHRTPNGIMKTPAVVASRAELWHNLHPRLMKVKRRFQQAIQQLS